MRLQRDEPAASKGRAAETPVPAPSRSRTRFQHCTGIQELCLVKRRATQCMVCDGQLEKNGWKFSYAYKVNKPPKSIHVTCRLLWIKRP